MATTSAFFAPNGNAPAVTDCSTGKIDYNYSGEAAPTPTKKIAAFTLFSSPKRLTKQIYKAADGSLAKKSTGFSNGTATRCDVASADELAALLDGLSSNEALAFGVTERARVSIGAKAHLKPGQVSRSRDNFQWSDGAGILFLDFDGQFDESDIPTLRETINKALPGIADAPQVWTRSSSAAIVDTETGETTKGGLHAYILVEHAASIPALGERLYDGLWLNGNGWYALSQGENPAALERALVDASVWQPERLDYAAAPVVVAPLERTAPTVIGVYNNDAAPLDARQVVKLSDAESTRLAKLRRDAKRAIGDQLDAARGDVLQTLPSEQHDAQRGRWLAFDQENITADTPLTLTDTGATIRAGDVLDNPSLYHNRLCFDPVDPGNSSANPTQAKIFADAKGAKVWSFAHGGRLFYIVPHAPDVPGDALVNLEPAARFVVSACYRHRAFVYPDAFADVAEETGASVEYARRVWSAHLAEKMRPAYRAANPEVEYDLFADFVTHALETGESALVLADLGTGKTTAIAGAIAKAAKKSHRPFCIVTLLRSLVASICYRLELTHYMEKAELLGATNSAAMTVHALASKKSAALIDALARDSGVLVIDEAASVAKLLFGQSSIISWQQQADILAKLAWLREQGTQIILLDGDATPPCVTLAKSVGCKIVRVNEKHYADPRAVVMPSQTLRLDDDGEPLETPIKTTPAHSDICHRLAADQPVVIATDSRNEAKRLEALYGPLAKSCMVLHASNADGVDQMAFRENPEAEAKRYQLVIYSPALCVGVSVTTIAPHVYVSVVGGTVDASGLWQMSRRYRCPGDGVVTFIVDERLTHPQRQTLGMRALANDIEGHARVLAQAPDDLAIQGIIATRWLDDLFDSNPLYALVGHLTNVGISVEVQHSRDTEGAEARKEVRKLVKETNNRRVGEAPALASDAEKMAFIDNAPALEAAQYTAQRAGIELGIAADGRDYNDDGTLPADIVEAALEKNLVNRVKCHALLLCQREGVDLSDDPSTPFAYRKHEAAQVELMASIIDHLGGNADDDSHALTVTASAAREVAEMVRAAHRTQYRLISRPPRKNAKPALFTRWLRDLLEAWGYAAGKGKKPNEGERVYRYEIDPLVSRFSARKKAKKLLAKSRCNPHGCGPREHSSQTSLTYIYIGMTGVVEPEANSAETTPGEVPQEIERQRWEWEGENRISVEELLECQANRRDM